MITLHKTEIAHQNNTVNIFWDPPKFQITFSGEPRGAELPLAPVVHTLVAGLHCTVFIHSEEHWISFCAGEMSKYMFIQYV